MSSESGNNREFARPPIEAENEVIIDRPDLPAVYKLIYSVHDRQNNPADFEFNNGEKPDCIVLERGSIQPDEKFIKKEMAAQYELGGQYKTSIIYAAENKIPLYLIDYKKSNEDEMQYGKSNFMISNVSGIGGLFLVMQSIVKNDFPAIKQDGLTRRNFLKLLGKAGAAAYLSEPMIDMATFVRDETDEHSMAREIRKKNRAVMSEIQPWTKTALLQGRNIIFAMLLDKLSKQLQGSLYKKPNVPFIVGSNHFEIEEELGKDEKSLKESLAKYLDKKEDLASPGSIIKVEFSKNNLGLYNIKITAETK